MKDALAAVAAEPLEALFVAALVFGFMSLPYLLPRLANLLRQKSIARARANIDLPVIGEPREPEDVKAIRDQVRAYRKSDNWAGIGQYIAQLSNSPVSASDGVRTYDIAIAEALLPLDEAEDHSSLAASLEPFRDAMRRLPQVPGLTGLHLRALQKAAWRARGTFEGRELDGTGMQLFLRWLNEIEAIVKDTGRSAGASILLAEPYYHASFANEDPGSLLYRRFENVVAADSQNPRLWSDGAHGLLPGWYGSVSSLGNHLSQAVDALGEVAVLHFTLSILPCVAPEEISGWSQERFLSAVALEANGPDGQFGVNYICAYLFATGEARLARSVARAYISEIHSSVWECEEDWLVFFDAAFRGKPSGRANSPFETAAGIAAE